MSMMNEMLYVFEAWDHDGLMCDVVSSTFDILISACTSWLSALVMHSLFSFKIANLFLWERTLNLLQMYKECLVDLQTTQELLTLAK